MTSIFDEYEPATTQDIDETTGFDFGLPVVQEPVAEPSGFDFGLEDEPELYLEPQAPEAPQFEESLFQEFPAEQGSPSAFADVPAGEEPYFAPRQDSISTLGGREEPADTASVFWEDVIKPTPARAAAQVVGGVGGGIEFAGDVFGMESHW